MRPTRPTQLSTVRIYPRLIGARRRGLAVLALAGLTAAVGSLLACVPPAPEPAPVAAPDPAPPAPQQTIRQTIPEPASENWMDAPLTPGDWSYRPTIAGGIAQFGLAGAPPRFSLSCNRAARTVSLTRAGSATTSLPLHIITEATERMVEGFPITSQPPGIEARVASGDRLLDAMAFSKGRFAVKVGGLETLYVPAWPEITRVVEDCR